MATQETWVCVRPFFNSQATSFSVFLSSFLQLAVFFYPTTDHSNTSVMCLLSGPMNRGMVPQRSPMGGSGDWGMPRSSASPVGSAAHPSMMRPGMEYNNSKGMMSGPMVSRSSSAPGSRSMLQQQLMEMGKSSVIATFFCVMQPTAQHPHSNDFNPVRLLAALPCLSYYGVPGGSADMGMGMSPFSQQGQPTQSPSWPDTMMGMEGGR